MGSGTGGVCWNGFLRERPFDRLRARLQPRALASPPPPAKAGGGWEGVLTVRADLEDPPPQPVRPASTAGVRSSAREPVARKRAPSPPAFAGEGAKARGCRRSYNGDRLSTLSKQYPPL